MEVRKGNGFQELNINEAVVRGKRNFLSLTICLQVDKLSGFVPRKIRRNENAYS
jgi:hypothetical protein